MGRPDRTGLISKLRPTAPVFTPADQIDHGLKNPGKEGGRVTMPSSGLKRACVISEPSSGLKRASVVSEPSSGLKRVCVSGRPSSGLKQACVSVQPSSGLKRACLDPVPAPTIATRLQLLSGSLPPALLTVPHSEAPPGLYSAPLYSEANDNGIVHAHLDTPIPTLEDRVAHIKLGPTPQEFAPIKKSYWPQLDTKHWVSFPEHAFIYSTINATGLPNHLGARLELKSGLNLEVWDELLDGYHDNKLCDCLRYGFPVGYTLDAPPTPVHKNHTSALDYPDHVRRFITQELSLGGLLGPFTAPPFTPWTHTAPIMTRPKKQSMARRVILDLSYPEGRGVNAGITKNCLEGKPHTYTLPSVQDLTDHVTRLGSEAYAWKADLARAYMQLRVDVGDTPLLGLCFDGMYFLQLCPSFGCRLSGSACQRTTNAVVYLMRKAGYWSQAYLDDFCGAALTYPEALASYNYFFDLTSRLGLQLAPEKCQPPTHALEWLGFGIDTVAMTVSVPAAKLAEVLAECSQWLEVSTATKKQVQSLAGKLVHVAKCIPHARRFISRILEALRSAQDGATLKVTPSFKADVKWFTLYAQRSNGVHLLDPDRALFHIFCDSSDTGGGGHSATQYYSLPYTQAHLKKYPHTHQREAVNLLVAYRSLKPSCTTGLKVVVHTDNLSSKYALQTGRTKDPVLAACARQVWLEAAIGDHDIEIRHKPGKDIPLADALSRMSEPAKKRFALEQVASQNLSVVEPALPCPFFANI